MDRDPVEKHSDGSIDLYGISTWEKRSFLDTISSSIHNLFVLLFWAALLLAVLVILLLEFYVAGISVLAQPIVGVFMLLSVLPALGLTVYVWGSDVTKKEPLINVVATFLFSMAFAFIGGLVTTLGEPLTLIPVIGFALFFFLVVAPIEEFVKWLAIRVYAYRSEDFNAVIDGAVYGAIAGLGFATIENMLYISQGFLEVYEQTGVDPVSETSRLTTLRALAGPGHVIYSGFAGYYLGLARFNKENAGPIIVKGLLIAALLHGGYNTIVTYIPAILGITSYDTVSEIGIIFAIVVVYDVIFGYLLIRKISRYKKTHKEVVNRSTDEEFREIGKKKIAMASKRVPKQSNMDSYMNRNLSGDSGGENERSGKNFD